MMSDQKVTLFFVCIYFVCKHPIQYKQKKPIRAHHLTTLRMLVFFKGWLSPRLFTHQASLTALSRRWWRAVARHSNPVSSAGERLMNAHQPFLFPAEDTCVTHPLNPPPVRGTWSLRSEHTNHTSSLIYTATATLAKASRSRLVCEVANPKNHKKNDHRSSRLSLK